jgi:hypothetical protein
MKDFNKQMAKQEMHNDMMADAFDMTGNANEDEADDIYNGILGEIGLAGQQQMGNNVG